MNSQQALIELDKVLKEWTSTTMGRRTFLLSMPLLLASCATPDKHRYREGDNKGQDTELTVAGERQLTKEVLPKMKKDYPPVKDARMQNYISGIGKRIVVANNLEGRPYNYNFTVVDVPYVNAFALPAGTVFVTAPLIEMAESEAELAGVVGHEIGHVVSRHTAERMDKAKKEQGNTLLYAAGGGILGGIVGFGLGRLLCKPKDNECLQKAALYGAAAGAGGGLLVQRYGFMANSREDEMEADRVGFRTSVKAGYSKDKVGEFYTKLQKMEEERKKKGTDLLAPLADALSTHPPSKERVTQMNELERSVAPNPKAITSTQEFDRVRKLAKAVSEQARERAKKQKKG